jgi:hypothetical protein
MSINQEDVSLVRELINKQAQLSDLPKPCTQHTLNQTGRNTLTLRGANFEATLSYGVPVVVVLHAEKWVLVTNKKYSRTTTKHMNKAIESYSALGYMQMEASPEELHEITNIELDPNLH